MNLRSHKLSGDEFICTPVDLSVSELVRIQGFVVGQGTVILPDEPLYNAVYFYSLGLSYDTCSPRYSANTL